MSDEADPKRLKKSPENSDTQSNYLVHLLNEYEQQKESNLSQASRLVTDPQKFGKFVSPLILDQVRSLPIYSVRDKLLDLIKANQVVIVKGETGSGKSTQIPKYLVSAGFTENGQIIAVTQPRRIAAKSLAERVARETGTELGNLVGYAVRFDKKVSQDTIIKYVTDGSLIKEATGNPNLGAYSVVMIDEAHERSIHTDLCFGLLKRIMKIRPQFRVIISSATLEEKEISKYFDNAPVFYVDGRTFPVEIIYEPQPSGFYLNGVVETVVKICQAENQGDILVFLAGTDDINAVFDKLDNKSELVSDNICLKPLLIQCHASMPFDEQQKIFEKTPFGYRKVILATNIAETTLTVEGMDFVVDCGYFKLSRLDTNSQMETLVKEQINKFQAIQRSGRAGRTRPGKCYRMYSENDFNQFSQSPVPEIKRYNVQYVILDIIAMGFPNPQEFEFMTPPSTKTVVEAIAYLKELSALDKITGEITQMGKIMGKFPVEPALAKVLLISVEIGCCSEVLKIGAMLCTQYTNIFIQSRTGRTSAHEMDPRIQKFMQGSDGDHLTLLNVFNGWEASGFSQDWCTANLVEYRYLEEAKDIMEQMKDILTSSGLNVDSKEGFKKDTVLKTFLKGYFRQIAVKRGTGYAYRVVGMTSGGNLQDVFLHPTSALFKKKLSPKYVMFHDILKTTKAYMKGCSEIKEDWR